MKKIQCGAWRGEYISSLLSSPPSHLCILPLPTKLLIILASWLTFYCLYCSFNQTDTITGSNVVNCDTDLCQATPCQNGGSCVSSPGSYACLCASGYHGDLCDLKRDTCNGDDLCAEGSLCVSTTDGYYCRCALGQSGAFCDQTRGKYPCYEWYVFEHCLSYFMTHACFTSVFLSSL